MDSKEKSIAQRYGNFVRRSIMGRNDKGERDRKVRSERERALEILGEETGGSATQSEHQRVMKALRQKKLK